MCMQLMLQVKKIFKMLKESLSIGNTTDYFRKTIIV